MDASAPVAPVAAMAAQLPPVQNPGNIQGNAGVPPAGGRASRTSLTEVSSSKKALIKTVLEAKGAEPRERFCDRCSKLIFKTESKVCEKGTKNGKKCKHCVQVKKPCTFERPSRLNGLFNELLDACDEWQAIPTGDPADAAATRKFSDLQKKSTRRLERGIRADRALKGPWRPDSQLATERDAATSLRCIAGALEEKNNVTRMMLGIATTVPDDFSASDSGGEYNESESDSN